MAFSADEILVALKLVDYYPSKLSYKEVTTIRTEDEQGSGYGLKLVSHLLKYDYKELERITSQINEDSSKQNVTGQTSENVKFAIHRNRKATAKRLLNPMDIVTVLLHCCDELLRQILVEKMVSTKASVPIIIPPVRKNGTKPMALNWSLQGLTLESSNDIKEHKYLIHKPNPIISFIRVANLHRSKSKLLSDFLSETNHAAFYHRECPNASARRGPSNGSVEVAWFQSTDNSDKDFQFNCNFFTILNLRGNANDFSMQTKFLCESSSLVVIMTDSIDSLTSWYEKVRTGICWEGTQIVVSIVSGSCNEYGLELEHFLNECPLSKHVVDVGGDSENEVPMTFIEWKTNMRNIIADFMKKCNNERLYSVMHFISRAKSIGFVLEDDCEALKKSKTVANSFVSYIHRKPLTSIFPLQGEPLRALAELERKILRNPPEGKTSTEDFVKQLRQKIKEMRKMQMKTICAFHELEYKLYDALNRMDGNTFAISLILANLESNAICDNKEQWIGLENIIREIGQIYEVRNLISYPELSLHESMKPLETKIYAFRAAELLLSGKPLELLNGDVSYIPTIWITEVFRGVAQLTGNGKVFVLSVIGVQSSGKSTLLNALFGLHFPTSAGRCTSGLHCHLLKIDKSVVKSRCDYVMILDAEGFRAPEHVKTSVERDNEAATLIVGLSDLTIINVEGEIWNEMKDILQIVVYALLRIKHTKQKMEFMPSCVFVHQKVAAIDVRTKLKAGKTTMLSYLDEMTEASAQREGYRSITEFNDVVTYNDDTDSYFLPNMWLGNPPFATIGSDYCRAVLHLKANLMKSIESRKFSLNFTELSSRICDLWQAILKENFVFSFRDTKQALDHQSLSSAFSGIESNFRNSNYKQMATIVNKITSLEDMECLTNRKEELNNELDLQLDRNCKDAEAAFSKILSSELYRDAIELWREEFDAKLKRLKENEKRKTKEKFDNIVNLQKKKLEGSKEMNLKQKEVMSIILGKIKTVSSINELDKIFDDTWDSICSEEKENYEDSLKRSKESIEMVIKDHLSKWEYRRRPTLQANQREPVIPEVTDDDIVRKTFKASVEKAIEKNAHELLPTAAANEACKQLFHECKGTLENFNGLEFDKSQVRAVFEMVEDFFRQPLIKSSETDDRNESATAVKNQGCELLTGVRFTKEFINKYLEAIGSLTCKQLVTFSEDFINRTHAYSDDKKRLKGVILRCGNNECLLAIYILDEIKSSALSSFRENVNQTLEKHNVSVMNKKLFMMKLLIDLAKEEKFEEYVAFFGDFNGFCENKIGDYVKTFFEEGKVCSTIASVNADIKARIKKIQKDINASLEDSNDMPDKLIANFSSKFDGKIIFSPDIALNYFLVMKDASVQVLKPIVDHLIADLDVLSECSNSDIAEKVKSCLEENCKKEMFGLKQSGCSEKCPFCSAPCLEQTKYHQEHKSLHYPIGVRGTADHVNFLGKIFKRASTSYESSTLGEGNNSGYCLVLECCPSLIQSEKYFRSQYTIAKYNSWYHKLFSVFGADSVKYKDYQKEFPDWQIPCLGAMKPNDNDYWKWLMANFGEDFAKKYKVSCPAICPDWKDITKEEALDSINTLLSDGTNKRTTSIHKK